MIRITMFSDNPYEAAKLANGVAAAYRDYYTNENAMVSANTGRPVVTILDPAEPVLTPVRPVIILDLFYGAVLATIIAGFVSGFVILITDLKMRKIQVSVPGSISDSTPAAT